MKPLIRGGIMKTNLRFPILLWLVSVLPATAGNSLVEQYWPMNSGDIKYYSGTGGMSYMEFWQTSFARFDLDVYEYDPEELDYFLSFTGLYGYSGNELLEYGVELGWVDYLWNPPLPVLEENLLANGGSRTFQSSVQGISVTVTITISVAGTVVVPAGTFNQCRSVSVVARIAGSSTVAASEAWVLAPKVGAIRIGVINENGAVIGYQQLTSGTVEGVDVRDLANQIPPTLTITSPIAGQRVSNAVATVIGTARDNTQVTEVLYQINNSSWALARTTNGWTNWTATVNLVPGTNTFRAYAVDPMDNLSPTRTVVFSYILSDRLTVGMTGRGTLTPNYSNAVLEINRSYSMTANLIAGSGYTFVNWTDGVGNVLTNGRSLQFLMVSNLTLVANFVDTNRPVVAITSPTANQRWSNAVFTARGTATDNHRVANLWYQLNSNDWTPADTTNNWTNWTASLTGLLPGTNVLRTYAADMSGNLSTTNSVNLVHVLSDRLTVAMMGRGTLTPNYSNAVLEINRSYSMMANLIAGSGYTFVNWTDGAGNVLTNGRSLQFIMASNLTLTANFVDTNRPVVTITSPAANQRLSNAVITVRGTASDNHRVSGVWFQLNGLPWTLAVSTNGWTNWTATVALAAETNILRAFAMDASANNSLTNSVAFVASNAFKMILSFDLGQSPSSPSSGLELSLDVSRWVTGRVQVSTDLVHWMTLTNFVSTNSPLRFSDPSTTNSDFRFYRGVTP
jgi:hypothetical protein